VNHLSADPLSHNCASNSDRKTSILYVSKLHASGVGIADLKASTARMEALF